MRTAQKSLGLGARFSLEENQFVLGVTVSRMVHKALGLELSYLYMSSDIEMFVFAHEHPGVPTISPTLASANLDAHFTGVALSIPVVSDPTSGRAFLASIGGGLAFFNPGPNHPIDGRTSAADIPVDLEVTVDPTITTGVGVHLPLFHETSLEIDFKYLFQFCHRGDILESRYLCSRDGILDHASLGAGLGISLP